MHRSCNNTLGFARKRQRVRCFRRPGRDFACVVHDYMEGRSSFAVIHYIRLLWPFKIAFFCLQTEHRVLDVLAVTIDAACNISGCAIVARRHPGSVNLQLACSSSICGLLISCILAWSPGWLMGYSYFTAEKHTHQDAGQQLKQKHIEHHDCMSDSGTD